MFPAERTTHGKASQLIEKTPGLKTRATAAAVSLRGCCSPPLQRRGGLLLGKTINDREKCEYAPQWREPWFARSARSENPRRSDRALAGGVRVRGEACGPCPT